MRPKTTTTATRMYSSIVVLASVAILCLISRPVSSWQLLEPLAVSDPVPVPTISQQRPAASEAHQSASPSQSPDQLPGPGSMAGKILDALVSSAKSQTKEESQAATTTKLESKQQVLKPRKSVVESSATRDIQQQIIQQHATIQQHQHQQQRHLSPVRKFSSSSSSSSFGESDGRDSSALSSIFDNFKSGITSRSSIVKAISDNKLARTLTDVGKTIGSNKYVAGAAAASALAALGLAVSKMLTPYMFAGGFSGAEPLMPSGSSMPETYLNPSRLSYGDYASAVSSSPPIDFSPPFGSTYPPLQQYSGYVDQTRAPATYLDTAGSSPPANYYTTGVYVQNPNVGPDGRPQQLFFTYSKKPTDQSQIQQRQQLQLQQLQQPQPQPTQSDVNGHYTQYYDSQPVDSSSSSSLATNNYNNQIYPALSGASNNYNDQQQSTPAYRPAQDYSYGGQQAQDFMSSSGGDQMPSASVEAPSYVATANQVLGRSSPSSSVLRLNQTGRRSGAVRLKLKDSERARAVKAAKELDGFVSGRPISSPLKADNYYHAGDKSLASPPLQQQTNSLMSSTNSINIGSSNKDQGQPALQANSGYNNGGAAPNFNIIRPAKRQTAPTTSDKPEALERQHRQPSNPWISVQQQQNPIDHRESSNAPTSKQEQEQRVFRIAKDYEQMPQADTFQETRSQVASGDISTRSGEQSADNNNVIKPIDVASTKSGKLAAQPLVVRQQQQQESSGGLNIMQAPRQLLHNGHASDQMSADEPTNSSSSSSATVDDEDESNSGQSTAGQRRGQSAVVAAAQGKSENSEDSS